MRGKKTLIAWLATACAAGVLSCGPLSMGTETGNGTSGAVMEPGGKPVPGARVALVPIDYNALEPSSGSLPICSTETDAKGRYCFSKPVQGYYNLFCDSGTNCAYLDSIAVSGEFGDTMPTVFLRKSGAIIGTALVSSGRSAPSAFVAIIGSRIFASVNADDGSFSFSYLAPGRYHAKIVTGEKYFFQREISLQAQEGRADTIKNPFLLVSTTVTALACDSTGVWIGTGNGLAHVRNGTWRAYGLPDGLSSSRINCLFGDMAGVLWAGTSLRIARIRNDTLTENILPSGMPAVTNITALGGDSSGNVWIGTPQGLFLYNGGGITAITGNDVLTGLGFTPSQNNLTAVTGVLCLQQETIVGTLHGVYFRDSAKSWREIPEMAALALSSIVQGRGNTVWFGTNQGVRLWDRINHTVAAPFDGQVTGAVTSLAPGENGSLYIGTANGLFVAVDSLMTKKDLGGGSVGVNALSRDREGALWVGTNDGVIRIDRNGIQSIR